MKKLLVLLFASFIVLSCTTLIPSTSNQTSLENTKWILAEKVSGTTPTLNVETGRISGNSGCNSYSGNATLNASEGTFIAGNLASTKRACPDMSQETTFLNMLAKANKYRISGNELSLYQDKILLLKFNQTQ